MAQLAGWLMGVTVTEDVCARFVGKDWKPGLSHQPFNVRYALRQKKTGTDEQLRRTSHRSCNMPRVCLTIGSHIS